MNDLDRDFLEKESQDCRRKYNYGDAPIGNHIFSLMEIKLGFLLVKRPIGGDNPGAFTRKYRNQITVFINSNMYMDKQIFGMAHELYHYFYDIQSNKQNADFSRILEDEEYVNDNERRANYFAAVFLVPTSVIRERFKEKVIVVTESFLYEILRLQCEYEIPFKTVIKRCLECDVISHIQYQELLQWKPRDEDGLLYKLAKQLGKQFFEKFKELSTRNKAIYFTKNPYLMAIENYNNKKISYMKLASVLSLYGYEPKEFEIIDSEPDFLNTALVVREGDEEDE